MAQRLRNGKVILYTGSEHGTSSSTPSCRMPSSLNRTKACTFLQPGTITPPDQIGPRI